MLDQQARARSMDSSSGFGLRLCGWSTPHVNGGDPGPAGQHPPAVSSPAQRHSITKSATVQGNCAALPLAAGVN